MSNLKKMDAALVSAASVKEALQLPFVKEMVVKNYQAITGRKDGDNYFATQVFELLTTINEKPDLKDCDRFSYLSALVKVASSGLSLQDGHVDLIKYGKILKASPNYKGQREQIRRMANIESVGEGVLVLKGEKFVWDKSNNKVVEHISGEEDIKLSLDNIRFAYVRVTFKDGKYADVVVSNEEIKKAKSKSKNQGENSVWEQWPGQMAKKVPVHRAWTIYYRRPEVQTDLQLGDYAKDEIVDIEHEAVEQEVIQEQVPPPPVQEVKVEKLSKKKDSMDDFLSSK